MKMYWNLRITGKYVYAVVKNDVGQAWKPASSAFVTYTTNRSDFVVQLSEIGVTGFYGPTSLPGTGPGRFWEIYVREGGTADHDVDEQVGYGFESIDSNVVQINGYSEAASEIYGVVTNIYETLANYLGSMSTTLSIISTRVGGFAGTGTNTIFGFFQALFRKDLSAPSQVGGTFTPTTDSMEAHTDGELTIKEISTDGMAKLISVDTGQTTAATGSVAKISQGTSDPETLLNTTIGGSRPAGSVGERLTRIPNAAPAANGGLPTVDANNRIVGVQAATNITSTAGPLNIDANGKVTVISNQDKTGYTLSSGGNTSAADAVAAQSSIATLITDASAAKTAAQADYYYADLCYIKDSTNDEYTVQWYKNDAPVTSGITSPTIQVIKRSDGTNLIASTALTQIGSSGAYKYDATGGSRLADGDSAVAVLVATIDSASRTWRKVIGKDIVI